MATVTDTEAIVIGEIKDHFQHYVNRSIDLYGVIKDDAEFISLMLMSEVVKDWWRVLLPTLYDAAYFHERRVDLAVEDIMNIMGFTYDSTNKKIIQGEFSMFNVINAVLAAQDDYQRTLAVELYGDMGINYNSTSVAIRNLTLPTIKELDDRLKIQETQVESFSQETLDKLLWVADHFESLKALAEDDITYIIGEVQDAVEPTLKSYVNSMIGVYEDRLLTVEALVAQHQFFFFDWLMNILAWLLKGMVIPYDDIAAAIKAVGEWFIDEIYAVWIKDIHVRLDKLEAGVVGTGLTEAEIRKIIADEIQRAEIIAGPQGPVGPPGPMGPIGPAGPPGEVELKIADYIGEINVLMGAAINKEFTDPAYMVSTIASKIIADQVVRLKIVEDGMLPIISFLTDDMKTSLTNIVEAFGTPEALLSYLVNAPEGQEEPMLDLMQLLITMTLERGIE